MLHTSRRISSFREFSADPAAGGPVCTLLVVTTSFCSKELIIRCDVKLVRELSLPRDLNVCGFLLRVHLQSAVALIDAGRVRARTAWDDYVSLGLVVKQILLDANSFNRVTKHSAASSLLSQLDFVPLA